MKNYILFHRDSDGRFAAYTAWKYLVTQDCGEIVMHEVQYGEKLPLDLESLGGLDGVYILDFSYSAEILFEISKRADKLVVLDHHKTAEETLADFKGYVQCRTFVHFDKSKSGALLAWEYFFPNKPAPRICALVNDRDLWTWEFGEETAAAEAYLRTAGVKTDWAEWDRLATDEKHLASSLVKGRSYIEYEKSVVKGFTSYPGNYSIVPVVFRDTEYRCCFYEGMGILHSEVAQSFYENEALNVDFTMEHRRKAENVMVFSLRSKRIDVSEIAKVLGGGGHKAAAGFQATMSKGLDIARCFYKAIGQKEIGSKILLCDVREHFEVQTPFVPSKN